MYVYSDIKIGGRDYVLRIFQCGQVDYIGPFYDSPRWAWKSLKGSNATDMFYSCHVKNETTVQFFRNFCPLGPNEFKAEDDGTCTGFSEWIGPLYDNFDWLTEF